MAIDGQVLVWTPDFSFEVLTVKENQRVKISIFLAGGSEESSFPELSIEDYSIPLYEENSVDHENNLRKFSSSAEKIFRECFGAALMRLYVAEEEYVFPFDVLVTKLTAARTEKMIRYLAEQREEIIRVCMSRTTRPSGVKDSGRPDPETVLSQAEKIISILLDHRRELQQQLRSKLIPAKIPGWRIEQSGGLIDPIDVVFNIHSLRPADGCQDVIVRGRAYSASAIDATALVRQMNVFENAVILGGVYSIKIVIQSLLSEIEDVFKGRKVAAYDKEYQSLGDLLIRLSGGAMHERCERLIGSAETIIRFLEDECGIKYVGEVPPKITPYVRSSRLYRSIFELYANWYSLGSPSLDGELFLIKLRSISKIFEIFVLFRIFDYLIYSGWSVVDFLLGEDFERLVPSFICFEKNGLHLSLSYEPQIFKFSRGTKNKDLVKLDHPRHPGSRWVPDYIIRLDDPSNEYTRYIVLDAKYSNPYWVEKFHLGEIYNKYYEHMSVYDAGLDCLSRSEIFGVLAVFPEAMDDSAVAVNMRFPNFGLDGRGPLMMPVVAGLPIAFEDIALMEQWLDKVLSIVCRSLVKNSVI